MALAETQRHIIGVRSIKDRTTCSLEGSNIRVFGVRYTVAVQGLSLETGFGSILIYKIEPSLDNDPPVQKGPSASFWNLAKAQSPPSQQGPRET